MRLQIAVVIIVLSLVIIGGLSLLPAKTVAPSTSSLYPSSSPNTTSLSSPAGSSVLQATPTATTTTSLNSPGCKRSGCSGEVCTEDSSEGIVSNCVFKAEYACYTKAKCEKQTNGKC